MKKIGLVVVVAIMLGACRGGWSCQKRYVEVNHKEKLNQTAAKRN